MDKKIDYFGRELNTGDIVVIQHKSKMEIGVCLDSKIRTSSTIDYASSSKYIYKLENPTQDEIAESRKIIKDYNILQSKKEAAKKAKGCPKYGTLVSGVYSTERGLFLYLGSLKITFYDKDNNIEKEIHGKYYFEVDNFEYFKNHYNKLDVITYSMYKTFNKGYKKITGLYNIIDEFKDQKKLYGTYSYKYYNFNTHNDEFGKMVVEEYKP